MRRAPQGRVYASAGQQMHAVKVPPEIHKNARLRQNAPAKTAGAFIWL